LFNFSDKPTKWVRNSSLRIAAGDPTDDDRPHIVVICNRIIHLRVPRRRHGICHDLDSRSLAA
jgi:hypothetical protein